MISNKGIILKQHFKTLSLLLALTTSLTAENIAQTTQEIRAFVLPEDTVSIRGTFKHINDTLDVFNLNQAAVKNDIYSALGDSSGIDFLFAYGAHQHISLYYNFEALNIDYAGDTLKNRKNDIFARVNFYDNPHNSFDDFSMDIGFVRNSSKALNPQLKDLSDNTYYLRFLLGSRLTSSLFNVYAGAKFSSIKTVLFNNEINRDEKSLSLGLSHTVEFSKLLIDSNYEYIHMFGRASNLTDNKSNHILKLNLSRAINDNFLIFVGTKVMLNQFNGLIPYLYNTQTQSAFDKTYSLLKLGFVYNFNYCLPTRNLR